MLVRPERVLPVTGHPRCTALNLHLETPATSRLPSSGRLFLIPQTRHKRVTFSSRFFCSSPQAASLPNPFWLAVETESLLPGHVASVSLGGRLCRPPIRSSARAAALCAGNQAEEKSPRRRSVQFRFTEPPFPPFLFRWRRPAPFGHVTSLSGTSSAAGVSSAAFVVRTRCESNRKPFFLGTVYFRFRRLFARTEEVPCFFSSSRTAAANGKYVFATMEDPANVFDCVGMIFTILKLALALSPIIVLASLFVFNTDTEEVCQTKRKPDFSLEPLE